MTNKTIIHLTDPLVDPISVRDYTTNSTIHPLVPNLESSAVDAASSIYLGGRGVPSYGERIFENMIQMLEHHSSASEPKNPIAGQLWYNKHQYIRTSIGFYAWNPDTLTWVFFNETVLPYDFNGSSLFYTEQNVNHPLYNKQIIRTFTTDLSIANPNTAGITPNNILKAFDGTTWKELATVATGSTSPVTPFEGQLWFDDSVQKLKVYNGSSWQLSIDDYLPISGGTLTGDLIVNGNVTADAPTLGSHLTTKDWVVSYVITGNASLTLDSLADVVITSPTSDDLVYFNGSDWVNGTPSSITSSINAKLPLAGGTMTGDINTNSHRILNVTSIASTDAANVQYVDDAIAGSTVTISGDASCIATVNGPSGSLVLSNSGVLPGIYNNSATSITPFEVDSKGRLINIGADVTITPVWSSIIATPTTLLGYGITDAQPFDADLTSIASLTGTSGLLRKTAANTWSLDTNAYITGTTLTGDVTGTGTTSIATTVKTPVSGNWFNNGFPKVKSSDGVLEIGSTIDFHSANADVSDFTGRIYNDVLQNIIIESGSAAGSFITAKGDCFAVGNSTSTYNGIKLYANFLGFPEWNIIQFQDTDTTAEIARVYTGNSHMLGFDSPNRGGVGSAGVSYLFNNDINVGLSTNWPVLSINYGESAADPDASNRIWLLGMVGRNHSNNVYIYDDTALGFFGNNFKINDVHTSNGSTVQWAWQTNGNTKLLINATTDDVYCDGAFVGGGADYAEMFEWSDGNPSNEDRIGKSVCFDGTTGKIRVAIDGDTPFGAISGNATTIGNDPIEWHGKYQHDRFKRRVMETVDVVFWKDKGDAEQGLDAKDHCYDVGSVPDGITVPENAQISTITRPKLNPLYDPEQEYTHRSQRYEWGTVGLVGRVVVWKDSPKNPAWIKVQDIDDELEEWLLK